MTVPESNGKGQVLKAVLRAKKQAQSRRNKARDYVNASQTTEEFTLNIEDGKAQKTMQAPASDATEERKNQQLDALQAQLKMERQETEKPAFMMAQDNRGASVNLTVNSNQTTKLVTAYQYHSFADQDQSATR